MYFIQFELSKSFGKIKAVLFFIPIYLSKKPISKILIDKLLDL